jgi:DNA polymerase
MDQAAAGRRFSLWLRGERAFGVEAVPLRSPQPASPTIDAPRTATEPPTVELSAMPMLVSATAPNLSREEKIARLSAMDQIEVRPCTRCRLCQTRTQTVFGEGDPEAAIFFIGEGPGENEDLQGRPFVGRAGELLNKMIAGMGLKREQVFIANIVKCRPPGNRTPGPDEVAACTPYLVRQLEIVRPRVIVTLGLPATRYMLETKLSMGQMRGQWQNWRGIRLMPTYHPAFLLRSYTPQNRQAVWNDLKAVMSEVGLCLRARGE